MKHQPQNLALPLPPSEVYTLILGDSSSCLYIGIWSCKYVQGKPPAALWLTPQVYLVPGLWPPALQTDKPGMFEIALRAYSWTTELNPKSSQAETSPEPKS